MQTIERPAVHGRFGLVKGLVVAYGAMGAAVFGTIVALAVADGTATSFMWTRSALVPVSAVIVYWLVLLAAKGSARAYQRARFVSIVAPIALVGVDLIPGACPTWFLLLQTACAVLLACAAVPLVRMRANFPK
ncbi:hypothetical protein [Amycolatopsis rubida]|uniref:Uncharacterized protein n=1 Tax=Amycolatopsis rubida TaxID=112413 RepID=A0A1I6AXV5_9PSEU|nr:hypothetical protein [Amycolatopsis rubida]SFQ73551.1 hypothetical protein SAMN05421854_121117 [Amycolatopsis rubida]